MKRQVREEIKEHGVQGAGESVGEHCTITLGKKINYLRSENANTTYMGLKKYKIISYLPFPEIKNDISWIV